MWKRLALTLVCTVFAAGAWPGTGHAQGLAVEKTEAIERLVTEKMAEADVPGLAVTIVQDGETVYAKGFGSADRERKRPVTARTLFELGSTTKAFTALAVLRAEEDGLLKREEPVSRYLPWLDVRWEGRTAQLQVADLLYQTTGVPFGTIAALPLDDRADALERTVRGLNGTELDFQPGTKHQYATVNYDVLALVLEKATGRPFEAYVREEILRPLGMTNSHVGRHEVPPDAQGEVAVGYKIGLLAARPYEAPAYRGNTAAGYVLTNAEDMALWLKAQVGREQEELIRRSHVPDERVPAGADGSRYAAGWYVTAETGAVWHNGSNPTFASYVALRPEEGLGVAVLANLDSAAPHWLAPAILSLLLDEPLPEEVVDPYQMVDRVAVPVGAALLLLTAFRLWRVRKRMRALRNGERHWIFREGRKGGRLALAGLMVLLAVAVPLGVWQLPAMGLGLNWTFLRIWTPWTLSAAAVILAVTASVSALSALPRLLSRPDFTKEVTK